MALSKSQAADRIGRVKRQVLDAYEGAYDEWDDVGTWLTSVVAFNPGAPRQVLGALEEIKTSIDKWVSEGTVILGQWPSPGNGALNSWITRGEELTRTVRSIAQQDDVDLDFGRFLEETGKDAQKIAEAPFESAGKGLGKLFKAAPTVAAVAIVGVAAVVVWAVLKLVRSLEL